MYEAILLSAIAGFGSFTQGLAGVGVVLIALPLMTLLLDIKIVIVLVNLLALTINIVLGAQLFKHMRGNSLVPMLVGAAPGIPAGVLVLRAVSAETLQILLGVVLLAYCGYALSGRLIQRDTRTVWAYVAGFLGGCLGGAITASGPPIIIYTAMQPWTKDRIKATMIGFFLITTIGVTCMHLATGMITPAVLSGYAAAFPGLALGLWGGMRCYGRISETVYRRIIVYLLLILGVMLLVKGLRG
ncbi:sulfite exporter TauE/SafE family protein [Megalodesulfovibrio paquesii]